MAKKYEELLKYIDYFKNYQKTNWTPMKKNDEGNFIASKPIYDKTTTNFLNDYYKINRLVSNYMLVVKNIPYDKPIESYTEKELLATLTKTINGEKMVDGTIAKACEDKRIYKILVTLERYS